MGIITKTSDVAMHGGPNVMVNYNGSNGFFSILNDFTDDFETHPNDITAVWWMTSDVTTAMPIFGIVQGTNDADGFRIEQENNRVLRVRTGQASNGVTQTFFSGSNNIPSGVACYMLSTDRANQTITVYRNDTAISMTRDGTHALDYVMNAGYLVIGRAAPNLSTTHFDGCLNRLWIDQRKVDFSTTANRRKFVTAGGNRVDYGTDGSKPFGAQPKIFVSGDSSTITQNGSISFSASNRTRSNLTDCSVKLP